MNFSVTKVKEIIQSKGERRGNKDSEGNWKEITHTPGVEQVNTLITERGESMDSEGNGKEITQTSGCRGRKEPKYNY